MINNLKKMQSNSIQNTKNLGYYVSDEAKEIARLKRELRDTQDALEILKKQSAFWETDTGLFHRSFKGRKEM